MKKSSSRIEYAISIKHWCEASPNATDDELRAFLERIEKQILEDKIYCKSVSKEMINEL